MSLPTWVRTEILESHWDPIPRFSTTPIETSSVWLQSRQDVNDEIGRGIDESSSKCIDTVLSLRKPDYLTLGVKECPTTGVLEESRNSTLGEERYTVECCPVVRSFVFSFCRSVFGLTKH